MQPVEALLPALAGFLGQALAADVAGVLGRIETGELLIQALHLVGQSARLGEQSLGSGQAGAQLADHVVVQALQMTGLVQQHLGLVLQLANLVVGHLQGAHCGQGVLHQVGRIDYGESVGRLHGQ
ncbi:hypothetical protein D3C76_1480690 [compost metagenome]